MTQTVKKVPLGSLEPVALRPETAVRPARCTVGLLTWNAGQDAVACVESLLAQTESHLDLIWIDNASTDGTVQRLRKRFPFLPAPAVNPVNIGFCAGHNQALAVCTTPYYLALNQDAVLAPDYIAKLCDWIDAQADLALTSGLILMGEPNEREPRVYSAGLVFPRSRFAFSVGMGGPVRDRFRERRLVPGVDGCAMMLRVKACRRASLPWGDVFPSDFFAYGEEVDLALRLARMGLACGVDGSALAWHRARGSGGFKKAAIRGRFFANHWLLTLRHDSWLAIARDLPWIARGELQYWLPEYLRYPAALLPALGCFFRYVFASRRFYRAFESTHGPTATAMARVRQFASDELK